MPDRAVVAISEDQQWLVVLDPEPYGGFDSVTLHWSVIGWNRDDLTWYVEVHARDTGQDAHEVLREFLEGRGV